MRVVEAANELEREKRRRLRKKKKEKGEPKGGVEGQEEEERASLPARCFEACLREEGAGHEEIYMDRTLSQQ